MMEILIVNDETSTRDTLRDVLTELGYKPILEARNGEEALQVIDAEKNRIRMIIADWEMPAMDGITLSDKLAERKGLDLIPFLVITSDLPASRLADIRDHHKRIDHSLFKPFRAKILEEAMKQAFGNRASKRTGVLWLGSSQPGAGLSVALSGMREGFTFTFDHVTKDPASGDFAVVFIDADRAKDANTVAAIAALKKTVAGSSAVWVAVSREPEKIFPFRTLCHLFVDPGSLLSADSWRDLLGSLHRRIVNGWEIERLSLDAKALIQEKKSSAARKALERLLALDPSNAETHAWLADLLIQVNDPDGAIRHELEAIRLNPCLPKPYIKLFEIVPRSNIARIAEVAASAEQYCPEQIDVLKAAVDALKASGHADRAKTLAARLQKLTEDSE